MSVITRSHLAALSCRSEHFSISEMAENELAKKQQVEQLKKEIDDSRACYNRLGDAFISKEQLLTFNMLERHPLVTDQVAYKLRWDRVDALYQFVDRLPAWVVDDEIMDVWASGREDDPQSFRGWEAKKAEWGQALLLSWAPARIGGGATSPMVKVYTAVIVCIHPCQAVMSIKAAARDLLGHAIATPTRSFSALCRLPRRSAKTFYPSLLNHSFLVLPYLGARGVKKVHLDTSIALNKHMVVRCLHQR